MELGLALLLVLAVARAAGPASVPPPGGAGRTRDPQASPAASAEGDMKGPLMATAARGGGAARPGQEQGPARLEVPGAPARPRTRRCTCLTYKDKECVYYCHLDIIWINTPERTVPYGLSSSRGHFRAKRALGLFPQNPQAAQQARRCTCVDSGDPACARFCAQPAADSRNLRGAKEPPERRKTRPERSLSRTERASRA